MSVVGTDQQFFDLSRFCACSKSMVGSVLGIDPTFSLGDFLSHLLQHLLLLCLTAEEAAFWHGESNRRGLIFNLCNSVCKQYPFSLLRDNIARKLVDEEVAKNILAHIFDNRVNMIIQGD